MPTVTTEEPEVQTTTNVPDGAPDPTPKKKKPATKKPGNSKPAKKTSEALKVDPAPGKVAPAGEYSDPVREKARKAGLKLSQYKVLQYLAKRPEGGEPATYDDIKAATGYYSCLTADCRAGKDGSLCEKGFAKEFTVNRDGKDKVAFTATAKGRKLFSSK